MKFIAALSAGLLLSGAALAQDAPDSVVTGSEQFEMKVITSGLSGPWELTYGPDDFLWVTERTAGRIVRIDPADGSVHEAVNLGEVKAPGGQDGLLGLGLHPELGQGTDNDFVYVVYTYEDDTLGGDPTVADPYSPYKHLYTKLVRLTYDAERGELLDPVDLITGMPASNDHNSGRLKIGPDLKLYETIGDGGKNQLGNWCIPIEAQRLPTADEIANGDLIAYQGKSLRINLDGTIPDDNPELDGVRSHVFTYGHRNMQGVDFGADGTLYASEQGPKTDDEVNILEAGGNYGWPHVAGFRDDKAYQYARWADATTPCDQLTFSDITIDPSVPVENETDWPEDFHEPLATLFTVPNDYDFTDEECGGIDFICWPTVAASSIEVYDNPDGVPGWDKSLLVTTLKRGSLYRVPLNADGTAPSGPIERFFQSENRFRDTAVSPDGKTIYVATDPGGLAEALAGGVTTTMANPGAILAFTYGGEGGADAMPEAMAGPAPEDTAAVPVEGGAPTITAEQVARGKTAYDAHCVSCHGPDLLTANYGPPLAGPYFAGKWPGQSVATLYTHVYDRMPPSRPASLDDQTYADLVAYILQVNGQSEGDTELPSDLETLGEMVIGDRL